MTDILSKDEILVTEEYIELLNNFIKKKNKDSQITDKPRGTQSLKPKKAEKEIGQIKDTQIEIDVKQKLCKFTDIIGTNRAKVYISNKNTSITDFSIYDGYAGTYWLNNISVV
jgi:hypothetical protein